MIASAASSGSDESIPSEQSEAVVPSDREKQPLTGSQTKLSKSKRKRQAKAKRAAEKASSADRGDTKRNLAPQGSADGKSNSDTGLAEWRKRLGDIIHSVDPDHVREASDQLVDIIKEHQASPAALEQATITGSSFSHAVNAGCPRSADRGDVLGLTFFVTTTYSSDVEFSNNARFTQRSVRWFGEASRSFQTSSVRNQPLFVMLRSRGR